MQNKANLSLRAFPNKALLSLFLFFSAFLLLLSCDDFDRTPAPYQISDVKDLLRTGNLPAKSGLGIYQPDLQDALSLVAGDQPKKLGVVYVTVDGGRDLPSDGRTWETAYPASKLKIAIVEAGAAAKPENPYLVLVGFGTYPIADIGTLNMKNNVAIVGGLAQNGSLSKKAKVVFDGGGKTKIFSNSGLDSSAGLYGVTITNGRAVSGGGMDNISSSPSLMQLTFSYNFAEYGGAINNSNSSLRLQQVLFSSNKASEQGGAMYNGSSSPKLTRVAFFSNSADYGGALYNSESTVTLNQGTFFHNSATTDAGAIYNGVAALYLTQVTFISNRADGSGGAMGSSGIGSAAPSIENLTQVIFSSNTAGKDAGAISTTVSSLNLTQATFFNNSATTGDAGGILRYSYGQADTLISNSIFWGNTKSQIYISNGSNHKLNIHNSVLQGGITALGYAQPPATSGAAAANTNLISSGIIVKNPNLSGYTFQLFPGAKVTIPAIRAGSPAIDQGLYVQQSGSTFYHSKDASSWYTDFDTNGVSGAVASLPPNAIDLTATDITGYATKGTPDIGAYEAR